MLIKPSFSSSHLHLPLSGASRGILELEEETVVPTEESEQVKPEYGEERHTEKKEDNHAQHMDYVLVNHEENSPPKPEACEVRGNTSVLEELHMDSKQTGLPGTQLANFPDTCQPDSLNERKDHYVERMSSRDDKRSPLESPGQEQSWMVLGHSEVGNPPSGATDERPEGSDKAVESASAHSLGKGSRMQALGETTPLEPSALEEASGLGSGSLKSRSQSRGGAGGGADLLQAVTRDNGWEMLSPRPSQKNSVPETEIEEETEFLGPRTRKPRPNG